MPPLNLYSIELATQKVKAELGSHCVNPGISRSNVIGLFAPSAYPSLDTILIAYTAGVLQPAI